MNKTEIIVRAAREAGITKAKAAKAFESIIESIEESLKEGEKTTIVGFGTFSVGARAERKGKNPRTGKEMTIKARKFPKFTPGSALKDAINS